MPKDTEFNNIQCRMLNKYWCLCIWGNQTYKYMMYFTFLHHNEVKSHINDYRNIPGWCTVAWYFFKYTGSYIKYCFPKIM